MYKKRLFIEALMLAVFFVCPAYTIKMGILDGQTIYQFFMCGLSYLIVLRGIVESIFDFFKILQNMANKNTVKIIVYIVISVCMTYLNK